MAKEKVIHARIDENLHNELLEKCNELGCTFSDYFVSTLENSLEDEPENDTPQRDKPIIGLKLEQGKIYDPDGNYIGLLRGFEPKVEVVSIE